MQKIFHTIMLFALIAAPLRAEIALNTSIYPEEGWMEAGWGQMVFTLRNPSDRMVIPKKIECAWIDENETVLKTWTHRMNGNLAPGKTRTERVATWFDPSAIRDGKGRISGKLRYSIDDQARAAEFRIEVPVAVLPEKVQTINGENIRLSLMESRFEHTENLKGILGSMDEMYEAMQTLTGYRPFDGEAIDFRESPRHFAWAYAGNPTVLNTAYVDDSLKTYSRGELNFGWIHELGHDFDTGIGHWYIPFSQWAEWQANFKLSYAWETCAQAGAAFMPRLWTRNRRSRDLPLVTGRQFNDSYFIPAGFDYLADPSRDWKTLKSDEIHSFHTLLVRQYGWELFRKWYRAYPALAAKGCKAPKTPEDKILLECALLSEITGDNLVPVFGRWRMPVDDEGVARIRESYPVEQVAEKLTGTVAGKWIDPLPRKS